MRDRITKRNIQVAFACAVLTLGAGRMAAQPRAAGCWVGKAGSGTQVARVILRLETGSDPSTVHVMSRTLSTDTLRDVAIRGDSVTFAFGTAERETAVATLLGPDGTLTGTVTRAGTDHPLRLERVGALPDPATALLGYWRGSLMSGGAPVLASGLRFAPAPCGQVYVTLDSPDQGETDLPITAVSLVGDSLRFEMEYLSGAFVGTVSASRSRITGTWAQMGNVLQLELVRDSTK
jgi:hypothetical protein